MSFELLKRSDFFVCYKCACDLFYSIFELVVRTILQMKIRYIHVLQAIDFTGLLGTPKVLFIEGGRSFSLLF